MVGLYVGQCLKRPCKKTVCLIICIFFALQLCCFQDDLNIRQVLFSMCSGVWVLLHVSLGPEHGAQVDLVSFTAIWRREHGRRPCIIQQPKACLGLYSITKSMPFMKGPGKRDILLRLFQGPIPKAEF